MLMLGFKGLSSSHRRTIFEESSESESQRESVTVRKSYRKKQE